MASRCMSGLENKLLTPHEKFLLALLLLSCDVVENSPSHHLEMNCNICNKDRWYIYQLIQFFSHSWVFRYFTLERPEAGNIKSFFLVTHFFWQSTIVFIYSHKHFLPKHHCVFRLTISNIQSECTVDYWTAFLSQHSNPN